MTDLTSVLVANRTAVEDLAAAGEETGPAFSTPRSPGKWSPAQIEEHVARTLEETASFVAGEPSHFPTLPRLLRPLLRGLFFNRVLARGGFPNAKTARALDPRDGPTTPADGRTRLLAAVARFDEACRAAVARGESRVNSPVFGYVGLADLARFQELHTRHHLRQMPGAPG